MMLQTAATSILSTWAADKSRYGQIYMSVELLCLFIRQRTVLYAGNNCMGSGKKYRHMV